MNLSFRRYLTSLEEFAANWTEPPVPDRPATVSQLEQRTLTLVLLVGGGYALQFAWLYFTNWLTETSSWPYNTTLFDPADRFRDYANMVWMAGGLDPYNTHQRSAYPPFANLIFWVFSLLPLRVGLLVFLTGPLLVLVAWGRRVLRGSASVVRWAGVPAIFLLSQGLLFGIDRANLELHVAALLIGWWWLYDRPGLGNETSRSMLLAAAIAMKLHPALFLLLPWKDARYRELLLTACFALLLTLLSAACFVGGAAKGLNDWLYMLGAIQSQVAGDVSFTHYGISIWGAIRSVYYVVEVEDIPKAWATFYSLVSMAALGAAVFWLLRARLERWRILGVLVVASLLIPSVSYEYKLVHLLLLAPGLLRGTLEPGRQKLLLVCFGLLLAPKVYGILFAHSSTAVVTNPLLLLAFGAALVMPAWNGTRFSFSRSEFGHRHMGALCAALMLIPVGAFLLLVWRRYLPVQEGWFHYYGDLIREGQRPYVDFYSFIQPLPLLLSGLLRSLSDSFITFRVYGLFERMVLFVCAFIWLRRYASLSACFLGILTAVFFYLGQTVDVLFSYYQTALVFALVAGLAADNVLRGRSETVSALIAGTATAAGFFCKQSSGLLVGLAIGFFLLVHMMQTGRSRTLGAFVLGSMVVSVPLFGWILSFGGISSWWQQVFVGGGASKGGGLFSVLFGFFSRTIAWHQWGVAAALLIGSLLVARGQKIGMGAAVSRFGKIGWWAPVACLFVVASYIWTGDYVRFYELFSGRPTKIWILGVCFLLLGAASVFYVWRALWRVGAKGASPVELAPGLAAGLCFAWMYAHGMSFSLEEHAALPGVALVLALGYDLVQGGSARCVRASIVLLALWTVTMTCIQRYTQLYSWWGWEEHTVHDRPTTFHSPALQGFGVAALTRDTIERVKELVERRAPRGGQVYTFPHLLFFNVITQTRQVGFAPVHYFDVCPDVVAAADAKLLRESEPSVIVWIEFPQEIWSFHETVFRGGKRSGQRDIEALVHDWVATGRYRIVETFVTPGYNWPLHVIEKVNVSQRQ